MAARCACRVYARSAACMRRQMPCTFLPPATLRPANALARQLGAIFMKNWVPPSRRSLLQPDGKENVPIVQICLINFRALRKAYIGIRRWGNSVSLGFFLSLIPHPTGLPRTFDEGLVGGRPRTATRMLCVAAQHVGSGSAVKERVGKVTRSVGRPPDLRP